MAKTVQVFEGDGLSEQERLEQFLAAEVRRKAAEEENKFRTKTQGLKMRWTVESQQDFVSVNGLDLQAEMVKAVEKQIEQSFLATARGDKLDALILSYGYQGTGKK